MLTEEEKLVNLGIPAPWAVAIVKLARDTAANGTVTQEQFANHEARISAVEGEVSDAIVTDQSQ